MSGKMMNCRQKREDAVVRLFCFHWAGGGSEFYTAWGKTLPPTVEVCGVITPGREDRFMEPAHQTAAALATEVAQCIHDNYTDKPVILFGHCMGAWMALETARILRDVYNQEPQHLIVSGQFPPHTSKYRANVVSTETMDDDQFIAFLRKLGGTPDAVLDNRDLMEVFLPTFRADSKCYETYQLTPGTEKPLTCPVTVFDGTKDNYDHDEWSDITSGPTTTTLIKGGHFYLMEEEGSLTLLDNLKNIIVS